jgi:hypothetical protein
MTAAAIADEQTATVAANAPTAAVTEAAVATTAPQARRPSTRPPHWAYEAVTRPDVPKVEHARWVRTPIDAFVLAKLEAAGVEPSADADRATFIRRATLDVWGVIPSPEDVDAFVKDRSPDAYEKLVDRLLASPQYGVRQARRWLDLARYADSTGFQGDQTRPNMWRYRDYVVDSFNADKPYDQFVKEQLAGDEIAPDSSESLIATGFLANYPDNRNSRDMVQRKYQITTDITDTVGSVFLAQTVQCARCHNHKFDQISQKEYFQLQAFFANANEVNDVPADVGKVEADYRAQQKKWEDATKDLRAEQAALLDKIRPELVAYQRGRYLPDTRESFGKPEAEWNGLDRWVNHRWAMVTANTDYDIDRFLGERIAKDTSADREQDAAWRAEAKRIDAELKKFDDLKPYVGSDTITALTELGHADAPDTFVFLGGDHEKPDEQVQPAFPAAIAHGATPAIVPTATSSGRRTALANWIASGDNPLTARVFVNRIWNQYFGTGIVKSVSNFGTAGDAPTNAELLDYLADEFVKDGWSVKALQREILLSSVYRQSSDYREEAHAADPENKLLGTFPRRRLEAEQVRDSLLAASGLLNTELGGPSVFPPVPQSLNAGNKWKVSKDEAAQNRRSLYIFTRRSVAYPLLEPFDMSSPQQVHSQRDVTTTPLQALTLYNSEIVLEWSKALAGRVIKEAGSDESQQLDRLYRILFSRTPDKVERATLQSFLDGHEKVLAQQASDGKFAVNVPTGVTPANPLRAAAFVDLVHAVANSNDFAYRF